MFEVLVAYRPDTGDIYSGFDRFSRAKDNRWYHDGSSADTARFKYGYDDVGNRTHVAEASGDRVSWTYDPTYQLSSERRSGVDEYDITYTYDPVGNRLVKIENGDCTTSTYNASNQLLTEEAPTGTTTYLYDLDGNRSLQEKPTGDRTTTTWDYENRTLAVVPPSNDPTTYTYDGDQTRVQREDASGETEFFWDQKRILAEFDGLGTPLALYTTQPEQFGRLVSQHRDAQSFFYHFDALGSIADLSDSAEVVTDTYVYYAFGKQKTTTGMTDNPFRYVGAQGYYYEDALDTYNLRARDYDPAPGVFTSFDPLGSALRNQNLYRYVMNDPINHTDPAGLWVWPWDPNASWNPIDTVQTWTDMVEIPNVPLPPLPGLPTPAVETVLAGIVGAQQSSADWFSDETTIMGQLVTGDIYGNQIWGDPGVYFNAQIPARRAVKFLPAPLQEIIADTPGAQLLINQMEIGIGFEAIYDWANDGQPGTGWNFFLYDEITLTARPAPSVSAGMVNVYNFTPPAYQNTFINANVGLTVAPNVSPSLGFAFTPGGYEQYMDFAPVTDPYSFYFGFGLSAGGSPVDPELSWQQFVWLNNPEGVEWSNLSPVELPTSEDLQDCLDSLEDESGPTPDCQPWET